MYVFLSFFLSLISREFKLIKNLPCCDDGTGADGPPNAEFELPKATPFGFVELGGGGNAAAATAAIAAACRDAKYCSSENL